MPWQTPKAAQRTIQTLISNRLPSSGKLKPLSRLIQSTCRDAPNPMVCRRGIGGRRPSFRPGRTRMHAGRHTCRSFQALRSSCSCWYHGSFIDRAAFIVIPSRTDISSLLLLLVSSLRLSRVSSFTCSAGIKTSRYQVEYKLVCTDQLRHDCPPPSLFYQSFAQVLGWLGPAIMRSFQ